MEASNGKAILMFFLAGIVAALIVQFVGPIMTSVSTQLTGALGGAQQPAQ